jgi:LuxR family transcriptional regulator, maltose regulon positive regulatory protein
MADHETSAAGGHGRFEAVPLLATKLRAPRVRSDAVPRPRLERTLDAGRDGVLTVVTAPPGFGKTTVVAQWLERDPAPIVWLTCGPEDDDPRRFFAYVLGGIDAHLPGVGREAADRLTSPHEVPLTSVLTDLLNDLHRSGPVVLVLDDYHVITHPDVHAGLSFLLDHAPDDLHVVIVSRSEPPLPRSRLRANGLLNEIGQADLRATTDEAEAFLREVMRLDLDAAAVAALERRTEGWLAGLQLAALSLRGESDTARVIDAFRGDHRFVLDYLAEEVLRGLDDDLQRFLLETCVLERLSGAACDAVTARAGGQDHLERLERQNVFTSALDDQRTWFRYHALFADALRRRLATLPPEHVRTLHARAGRWYAEQGQVGSAVRHYVAAEAFEGAAALVEGVALRSLEREGPAPLSGWLEAFPAAVLERDPRLAIAGAWARLAAGHVDAAEALTAVAQRSEAHDAAAVAALRASFAFLRATLRAPIDDVEGLEALSDAAVTRLGPDQGWQRGTLLMRLGVVAIHAGAWPNALRALHAAERAFSAADSRYGILITRYALADAARWRGHLTEAEAGYRAMLALGTRPDGRRIRSAAFALFGLARLAFERDDLAAAAAYLGEGLALGDAGDPQLHAEGSLTLAQVRLAQGDPDAAEAALTETAAAGAGDVMTPVARPIAALRAGIALARGDLTAVNAWLNGTSSAEPLVMGPGIHIEHVTRARALLALGCVDEAAAWLERLRSLAERHERRTNLVEITVVQAVTAAAAGHGARALALLRRALELAQGEGHLRPFAAEASVVGPLLEKLVVEHPTPFARRVAERVAEHTGAPAAIRAVSAVAAPVAPAASSGPAVEPLSERERTVLRLLVAGATNKEIARELDVSVNTVKTHVRNVYAKLGVRNRGRLAAVTHELGLLG